MNQEPTSNDLGLQASIAFSSELSGSRGKRKYRILSKEVCFSPQYLDICSFIHSLSQF